MLDLKVLQQLVAKHLLLATFNTDLVFGSYSLILQIMD
jgi:hypothetical protein